MLALNDPIMIDILSVLLQGRLRRCKIRDKLLQKYESRYARGSFDVVLQRRLDKLSWIIKKEYVERAAFYSIREEMKAEVELLVKKQETKEKIEQMTPQQYEEFMKFLAFLVESNEGEEFWLWLPNIEHPEIIKKFKNIGTKILRQD